MAQLTRHDAAFCIYDLADFVYLRLHAETAMWLIGRLLPVRFRVGRHENGVCVDVQHTR